MGFPIDTALWLTPLERVDRVTMLWLNTHMDFPNLLIELMEFYNHWTSQSKALALAMLSTNQETSFKPFHASIWSGIVCKSSRSCTIGYCERVITAEPRNTCAIILCYDYEWRTVASCMHRGAWGNNFEWFGFEVGTRHSSYVSICRVGKITERSHVAGLILER